MSGFCCEVAERSDSLHSRMKVARGELSVSSHERVGAMPQERCYKAISIMNSYIWFADAMMRLDAEEVLIRQCRRHDVCQTQQQLRVDVTEGAGRDVYRAASRNPHA